MSLPPPFPSMQVKLLTLFYSTAFSQSRQGIGILANQGILIRLLMFLYSVEFIFVHIYEATCVHAWRKATTLMVVTRMHAHRQTTTLVTRTHRTVRKLEWRNRTRLRPPQHKFYHFRLQFCSWYVSKVKIMFIISIIDLWCL